VTAPPPPAERPHLTEEQLSSILDGTAGTEVLTHARTCSECSAEVARWRRARDRVASAPPAPAHSREAAIRLALAVFDDHTTTRQPEPFAIVGGDRGHRRIRLSPRLGVALAAAAAALLLVAGLGIAGTGSGPHHHPRVASGSAPASTVPSANGSAASGVSSAPAAGPVPAEPLGSFPDTAALVPVLRARVGEARPSASAAPSPSTAASRCQPVAARESDVATTSVPDLALVLTYAGTPAVVYAYPTPAGHTAVVLSAASCLLLAKTSF
jgi:hypothetical protein